jgi:arsenite-transporting ATPase
MLRVPRSTRLLIVGGKGGVGKTTCAATIALSAAREAPARRVLLVSTDPAPSIGDLLGRQIGDAERRVQVVRGRTLVVREIDAARRWREWRDRYRESIEEIFTQFSGPQSDLAVDRVIVEQLFELAPPGMDEIVAVLTMIDALTGKQPRFDLVVVDSAPTGHTLRLLELPDQAHAWVHELMAVVLKYHLAGRVKGLSTDLVWLARGLTKLQALLTNPRACGFAVVSRPEQLVSLETARLIEWLDRQKIARRALIVNGLTPPGCARCVRAGARERRQLAAFTRRAAWRRSRGTLVTTDAVAPPPKGARALLEWAQTWRAEGAKGAKGAKGARGA